MKCTKDNRHPGKLYVTGVVLFFAVIYALVILPNHLLFRTYALDLGLYTHAAWLYAHGVVHDSTLFMQVAQPILADHFDLYLPLFSPLVLLLGTWSLLIVQYVAILLGGWGVRMLLLHLQVPPVAALVAMIVFYGSFT